MNRKGFLSVFSATLILGFTGGAMFAQDATPEEDVFELSPFEVSTNSDAGYYASQTLSGGRVNSRIEDLGTSIQVVTEELMQDLNATSADEILLYTANTDVGGPSGNISTPAAGGNGTPDDTALRVNPAGNNRIRAIGSADLTRNFFRTSIPFDSYNSGRLDILRGANSFLFGLGSPSGIMNYGLDRAEFRNSGQLGIRFTNEDLEDNFSRRFELNVNQVLAEDMLAVRVAGVLDRQEYVQELAKTDTDRFYGALTFKPLKNRNIYLRVTGETGDINSVPPSALGPLESLSSWLDNKTGIDFGTASGRFIADPYTNVVVNNHTYQGKDANGNNLNIPTGGTEFRQKWGIVYDGTEDANGLPTRAMQYGVDGTMWRTGDPFFDPDKNYPTSANRAVYFMGYANINEIGGDYAGYRPQGLTDYSVFDFRKSLLMGGVDRVESDFDTYNISLEATSKDRNFGIELVYNSESFERTNTIPVGNPTLFMDLNRTLVTGPNSLFGDTNPNFGRIFVTGSNASIFSSEVDRKTYRATAYGKIDFREKFPDNRVLSLLGNHTLTMLLDSDKRNEYGTELRMYSFGNNADWHLAQTNGTMFTRQANYSIYVSPAYPDAFTDPTFKMTDFKGIQPRTDVNLNLPSGFSVPVSYYDLGTPYFKSNPTGNPFGYGSSKVANFNPAYGAADGTISEEKVESYAFNTQSKFLGDHLVVNLGWRKDKWESKRASAPESTDPADEKQRDFSPEVFNLDGVAPNEVEDENFSYNFVLHVPGKWLPKGYGLSFHYGESSNFIPATSAFATDGTPVPSGSGENKDYGFTLSAMDNKLIARFNWYETNVKNEPYPAVTFGYAWTSTAHMTRVYAGLKTELYRVDRDGDGKYDQSYLDSQSFTDSNSNGILDHLEGNSNNKYISLPELRQVYEGYAAQMFPYLLAVNNIQESVNPTTGELEISIGNGAYFTLADTADVSAKGLEFEMVYNPTPKLRIGMSVVQQKASRTNLAPRFGELFNALLDAQNAVPAFKGTRQGPRSDRLTTPLNSPTAGGTVWNQLTLNANAGQSYYLNTSLSGADNPEVRKWRVSLYGNYSFTEGRLKGANIGGAYRYVDNAAIGYGLTTIEDLVLPDVNTVFFDNDTHSFDIWAGYSFKVAKGVSWKIQLNIRNLFADSDPLPVQMQPDGSIARVRYAPPRTFLLQNTITF